MDVGILEVNFTDYYGSDDAWDDLDPIFIISIDTTINIILGVQKNSINIMVHIGLETVRPC